LESFGEDYLCVNNRHELKAYLPHLPIRNVQAFDYSVNESGSTKELLESTSKGNTDPVDARFDQ